jgi:hypothetical protein
MTQLQKKLQNESTNILVSGVLHGDGLFFIHGLLNKLVSTHARTHTHTHTYIQVEVSFPCSCHEGLKEEKIYSSTCYLPQYRMDICGQLHDPATLSPGKSQRPIE